VVTITRLDRLARSTADLLAIAERIKEAGAGLRSLAEPWADTTTPAGRMVLTVFAGIADFERSLIAERTSAGRIAAKARGVRFGPSPALSADQVAHARQLIAQDKPVAEVARLLKVHRATLYRALSSNGTENTHKLAYRSSIPAVRGSRSGLSSPRAMISGSVKA
jgi:DNA invertase Pin-like site-specific DNA recombinase